MYVEARRVLLDALQALQPFGPAVIVAGAQAVYLRTGSADLGIAPYTTDGDLTLDPSLLGEEPALEHVMAQACFRLREPRPDRPEPGIWLTDATVGGRPVPIEVDLIVPDEVGGAGRHRGARLAGHDKRAARRIPGMEAVLVDHTPETIAALDPRDGRECRSEVAGVAGLLISKLHKIHDRLAEPHRRRVNDKDAADVYRLMQTSSASEVGARMRELKADRIAGRSTEVALGHLDVEFGRRRGQGVAMAVTALRLAIPEDEIRAVCAAFVEQLLDAADHGR